MHIYELAADTKEEKREKNQWFMCSFNSIQIMHKYQSEFLIYDLEVVQRGLAFGEISFASGDDTIT